MGYIGNMHTHFKVPVGQPPNGERIVKILRIGRIDRKGRHLTHIAACRNLLRSNIIGYLIRLALHLFRVAVRQIIFGQDRVHFGIVVAGCPEHIHDFTFGALHRIGPSHDPHQYFLTLFRSVQTPLGDKNIVRHFTVVDPHESKIIGHLDNSHISLRRTLHDPDHFSFGVSRTAFTCNCHLDPVTMQRVSGPRFIHEDILVHTFDNHI